MDDGALEKRSLADGRVKDNGIGVGSNRCIVGVGRLR